MEATGGDPVFRPEKYVRGFTRAQIVQHLRATVEIVEDVNPPEDLRVAVFNVAQQLEASMQPVEEKVRKATLAEVPARAFR